MRMLKQREMDALKDKFIRLDIHEIENANRIFCTGMLDRFATVLSVEESRKQIILYSVRASRELLKLQHYYNDESKYIDFCRELYRLNIESPIYVYRTESTQMQREFYLQFIEDFDEKEKRIIDELYFTGKKCNVFAITKEYELETLLKLTLREIDFFNFFFYKMETAILGNYEMCLPIYCLDEIRMMKCKEIATQSRLFIRR